MARNNLKQILEAEGVKQSDLSKEADISPRTISRIANQKDNATPVTRTRIVRALSKLAGKEILPEEVFPHSAPGKTRQQVAV